MKEIQYKNFSARLHGKLLSIKKQGCCQFELTFGCSLHCRHCYCDCYNKPRYLKRELNTAQVLSILDKLYAAGVLWLCFTGGDPLTREDFPEIYVYARKKGFIIIIFTNGTLINDKLADCLKDAPPFYVGVTLNAITQKTYENISQVKGSYEAAMQGIKRLLSRGVPLKIKALATKLNYHELGKIKAFAEENGLEAAISTMLYPRLNGDPASCKMRLAPERVVKLEQRFSFDPFVTEEIKQNNKGQNSAVSPVTDRLFRCVGGEGMIYLDPYGRMVFCTFLRKPSLNLLSGQIQDGTDLFVKLKEKTLTAKSPCPNCGIRYFCHLCPARAKLEMGDSRAVIPYFCRLAHLLAGKEKARA